MSDLNYFDRAKLNRRVHKLASGIFGGAFLDRTNIGDRTNLDDGPVFETGALPRDFNCFIFVRDLQIEIAANRFFRLRKGPVRNGATLLARNDLAFFSQGMAAGAFSFRLQSLE